MGQLLKRIKAKLLGGQRAVVGEMALRMEPLGKTDVPAAPVFAASAQRRLDDYVDIFRCFFTLSGRVHSVHRSFRLLPAGAYRKGKLQESLNTLSTYSMLDGKLELQDKRDLGHGTDPRVVSDGHTAYIFQLMRRDGDQEKSFYRVLKLPDETSFDIEGVADLPLGKNWQPFLRDGKLYAIYGFQPLTVIEISEDGRTKVVVHKATQLDIFPPHQKFSIFRGGSNGVLANDGCIYGFGHLTIRNFRHDIFMWRLDPQWNLDIRLSSDTIDLNDRGFLITDPTSLFEYKGDFFIGLALSERDWFYEQKFADIVVKLPSQTLPGMFARCGPILPNLDLDATGAATISIPPGTCQTDIGSTMSNGSMVNGGRAGCVLKSCFVSPMKFGQNLTEIIVYLECSDLDTAGSINATVWHDSGFCLEKQEIRQRGRVRFSLDLSKHARHENNAFELRLICSSVDVTIENIRAVYSVGLAAETRLEGTP